MPIPMQHFPIKIAKVSLAGFSISLLISASIIVSGCSFLQYQSKPIDVEKNSAKFQDKDPQGSAFQQYLLSNGYPAEQLPIKTWGVEELTYCALYFHPSLDVARAQMRASLANENIAGEKPLPGFNSNIARSNQANQDINPFAYTFSLDIPIETAGKRDIRIANAKHLTEATRLEIAQSAWQLRQSIAQALYDYQFNQQQLSILSEEEKRRQEIVAIYQKRVEVGMLSNVELSTAKFLLQTTALELNNYQQNKAVLLAKLAAAIGVSVQKVQTMVFAEPAVILSNSKLDIPLKDQAGLQTAALLNRLDIRIALEKYAAAESKLKLEIAKQYPDITISPGYAYEFGDKVWSLGLNGLLNMLQKNKNAIAQATELRELEAAQFEALQNKVISEVEVAKVQLLQARESLINQLALYQQQQQNTDRMQKRLSAGEIDRLELAFVKLEDINARKNTLSAEYKLLSAVNQLENTLQQPLAPTSAHLNLETLSLENSVKN